jgi:hypothetical protein
MYGLLTTLSVYVECVHFIESVVYPLCIKDPSYLSPKITMYYRISMISPITFVEIFAVFLMYSLNMLRFGYQLEVV